MSFPKSLKVCIAALMMPFRSSPATARAERRLNRHTPTPALLLTGIMAAGIAVALPMHAAAQEPATSPDSDATASAQNGAPCEQCDSANSSIIILNPNPIMGFENPALWSVRFKGKSPYLNVKSTTVRTEGNAALVVANPASEVTLTSSPIPYTTKALAGIGNNGAVLQLDIRVQPAAISLFPAAETTPETANASFIEAFVSSRSRGLNNVPLGQVTFQKFRTGIYNTVSFTIPESVSSALHGEAFSDLIFEFAIDAPSTFQGSFLFDNLRVHSVELVQSPTGSAPPASYGGSLNLAVAGSKPVVQTFALAPVQVPSGFHLKQGTVGTTSVQLELGLDGSPELTCGYAADSTDTSNESYTLKSCTGGFEAGDLVNSNWVTLSILRANSAQQLHAQLSVNPLGSLSGAKLLPPMPTYWGDAANCTPAPVAGKVVTISTSCANQRAKANQIVTEYFNQVNSTNPSPNWIVTPVPEAALRSGDGTPIASKLRAELDANDLPFSTGGDLNPGGSFDAYWKLSGNLDPTAVAGTDENLTHFDAAFTAHAVLFGDDVDAVDAKLTADTDSGETTPTYKPAKSSGTLNFYVLGEEIPSNGLSFNPSTGFSIDPSFTQEYNLPPIQVWIFDITLGANIDADLNVQGSAALSGADLSVIPTASLGGHISGGINLGIAEGSVDAKVNLITLSVPTSAQVKWELNTDPALCAAEVTGSVNSDLTVSSGGGEVDLDATFGICPFCYTDSHTLFKWGALASKSWNLFDLKINEPLFGLPTSMCGYPITVSIVSPTSGASLSSNLPIPLTGSASPTNPDVAYTSNYNWTYTPGAHAGTITVNPVGANSANPNVVFGPPTSGNTSTWTIGLTATTSVRAYDGSIITETATATPVTVTVTNIPPGAYINQVNYMYNGVEQTAHYDPVVGALNLGNIPTNITVSGLVSGGSGTLNSTFTVVPCNDGTSACTSPGTPFSLTTTGASTAAPTGAWPPDTFQGGYYKITMNTTAGAVNFGSASTVVYGTILF